VTTEARIASRLSTGALAEQWPRLLDRLLGPVPDVPRPRGLDADRRATIALWSAAVLLILLVFNGGFRRPGDLYPWWDSVGPSSLGSSLYWVSWGWVFYLAVPLAIILFVFKDSPGRYGVQLYLTRRTALLYGGMVLFMLPLLFWASTRESFLATYPFVEDLGGNWPLTVAVWEVAYVSRFVCLEFFFRGYLLFSLEEKLGYTAIAASAVPYAMIHYAKPFPEALGAIAAGAVLGLLALRTRTILGGAIMHATVAVSMDMFALWREGYFH
jgi:membrane protease YdiL (CAAX protease family)